MEALKLLSQNMLEFSRGLGDILAQDRGLMGGWWRFVVWGWGWVVLAEMEGFPRNAGGNDGVSEMISQGDYGGSTQILYERKDG